MYTIWLCNMVGRKMNDKLFAIRLKAVLVSLGICIVIFSTLGDYGVTTDEADYIEAGTLNFAWLKNPSLETIDAFWERNHEQPPLVKILAGATRYVFRKIIPLFNDIIAARLAILFFVFLLNFSLFLFVAKLYGQGIAFLVTAMFSFLPRVFYHAHLVCLDYPLTALWVTTMYAYWKSMEKQRWTIIAAVGVGLALLTKGSAFIIYMPLLFYWLLFLNQKRRYLLAKIIPIFVIPPLIFFLWPWMWHDTIPRLIEYAKFYLHHYPSPVYYFGKSYRSTPWHYPFVMTLITIPLVILIPFLIGGIVMFFGTAKKTNAFILINALTPLLAVALNRAKYGGERLFLPAFPFICIIAGIGLFWIFRSAKKIRLEKLCVVVYFVLLCLTTYNGVIKTHPYQIAYYNEIIGGVDGAEKKGFETMYFSGTLLAFVPWLNEHPDSTVYLHRAYRKSFLFYQRLGVISNTISLGDMQNSDYMLLESRQGWFDDEIWRYYKQEKPIYSVMLSKTRLASVYALH